MQKLSYMLTFLLALFTLQLQYAGAEQVEGNCDHDIGKSYDNFFAYARVRPIATLDCDNGGLALLGEMGARNYRFNGTYGFFSDNCHRFKLGAEWLTQKIHYKFSSGRALRWTHQVGVGGKYQYWFECPSCFNGIQLALGYSHAMARRLPEVICLAQGSDLERRVSDSIFWNAEAGVIMAPLECGNLILSISYDNIRYHREHQDTKRLSGVGFSLDYTQKIWCQLVLDIKAQIKRPYNYLEAMLNWTERFECGDLTIGVFGNHVWGKYKLPSSSAAGGEVRFTFGINPCSWFNCCNNGCNDCCEQVCCYDSCELANWIADPAIYRPQALAIGDQRFESVELVQ